jgi:LacI family transcriptional regulator
LALRSNYQRAVTLRELAREVGVSPSTVSRVLNRDPNVRVSATSRSRILDLAAAKGYRPNRLARSLKLQRTNVIGMLIPDITNPLFSALFRAVDEVASAAGYHVILCNTGDSGVRLQQHLEALSEGHVDGLLIATARRSDPVIETLRVRRLPYILVSRRSDSSAEAWVIPDDRRGAHLAVKHLVQLGHRRIAHIAGFMEVSRSSDRLEGYREAMDSFNLEPLVWLTPAAGLDEAAGEMGLKELLKSSTRPTAIFTANDLAAVGVIAHARQLGLAVPRDLSVIGCDDIPMSKHIEPALTTVRYPFEAVGQLATGYLIRHIAGEAREDESPPQIALPLELIVRQSTANRDEKFSITT